MRKAIYYPQFSYISTIFPSLSPPPPSVSTSNFSNKETLVM